MFAAGLIAIAGAGDAVAEEMICTGQSGKKYVVTFDGERVSINDMERSPYWLLPVSVERKEHGSVVIVDLSEGNSRVREKFDFDKEQTRLYFGEDNDAVQIDDCYRPVSEALPQQK